MKLRLFGLCLAIVSIIAGVVPAAPASALNISHVTDFSAVGLGGSITLQYPTGVAADKFGNVFVLSPDVDRVDKFNSAGAWIASWGVSGSGDGQLNGARAIDVDRWGNVFVADQSNSRVQVFAPNGLFTRVWSGTGGPESSVVNPNGIAVSLDGAVAVSDNGQVVTVWSRYGDFQGSFTPTGSPVGVTFDQDGDLLAAHDEANVVKPLDGDMLFRYGRTGVLLDSWGGTGTGAGEFRRPYDVAADGAGTVYVVEAQSSRVQAFDASGAHLATFGSAGSGPGQFVGPYSIAAGYARDLFIADTFNDRISKWRTDVAPSSVAVSGSDRISTAIEASKRAYPRGADAVVIATGYGWADALGGASLAGALRCPLLLTGPGALDARVGAEITRLGVQEAYVLGGTSAVGASVETSLRAKLGATEVRRLGGQDRYGTAALVAAETRAILGTTFDGMAFVVTGADFPDALGASPISAANGCVAKDRLANVLERWEAVIGLEIHTELTTLNTKMFCGCPVAFGGEPNTRVCPVCLGMPGALPVPNRAAIEATVLAGVATNCTIAERSQFHRKNYFYPDMPKNYQISQYDLPFCERGTSTSISSPMAQPQRPDRDAAYTAPHRHHAHPPRRGHRQDDPRWRQ
jgi:hypothetical protein